MKKNHKIYKPFSQSFFILIGIIIFTFTVIVNILSFFLPDADRFNLFHKYDEVYSLETWNIPNNVDIDINGDSIEDRITFTGCVILSGTQDKDIVSKQYDCYKDTSKGIRVFDLENRNAHQVVLSYIGKMKNENWNIVLVKNLHVYMYEMSRQGEIVKIDPPFNLRIDSFLYFISHLFALFIW